MECLRDEFLWYCSHAKLFARRERGWKNGVTGVVLDIFLG